MTYKNPHFQFLLLLIFFAATNVAATYFLINQEYMFGIMAAIGGMAAFYYLFRKAKKPYYNMQDFLEAVKWRDFSRKYSKKDEQFFNEINKAFLELNTEKETQQQYLKKILDVVDTGILAYKIETNEIFLSNEAFRKMMHIPSIKSVNWLRKRDETLYENLLKLQVGDNKIISLNVENQRFNLLVNVTTFQTLSGVFKLIAFQNVNATLEEAESTAWKRLLSVMTHEIMNSIAPVSSLADTLKCRIDNLRQQEKPPQPSDIEGIETGIETIKRRSDGLLRFAETYRNLNKSITLHPAPTNLKSLFENIYRLMNPSLKQQGIEFRILTQENLPILNIDATLIEQALINLISNASDAVREKENPYIILSCNVSMNGKIHITVADNGIGITPDLVDKIFIPFFSSKKKGSGIGLSLSRQIVKLHKGSIQLQTKQGEGSAFTIIL